jgi:hypothetical protein
MSDNSHALDHASEPRYELEFVYRPGTWMTAAQQREFVAELRDVASECFTAIPEYQCLAGTQEELADKVIAVARREDGRMVGFCSCVLLDVPTVGTVLHLGLTCVRPGERGGGLTHKLTTKAVTGYMIRYSLFSKLWITNVACVLSSLANVALNFDDVYPMPGKTRVPSDKHLAIARTYSEKYRHKLAINDDSVLDEQALVFRRSVEGTVFQKDAHDARFHHRVKALNDYYIGLLHFEEGDEAVQVGNVSVLTVFRYLFERSPLGAFAKRAAKDDKATSGAQT